LRYAPKKTNAVLSVGVEELLRSKFLTGLGARERDEIFAGLDYLGIPLSNISRATLFSTGGGGSLWVLRTKTDLDPEKVLDERFEGERARSTFTMVSRTPGQGGVKTIPAPTSGRERWKTVAVGKYKVYENDLLRIGGSDVVSRQTFCVPEPRVCLCYSMGFSGTDVSLLRRVLEATGERPLSASLKAALEGGPAVKPVYLALAIRNDKKLQTRMSAGGLGRVVRGVDWAVLSAEINEENSFAGTVVLGCAPGQAPGAVRKEFEDVLAKSAQRSALLKEVQRSLSWEERDHSLVVGFRVDAQELYLMICQLGRQAESTFKKVSTKIGPPVGVKK
jgi:hypothetical protein